MLLSFKSKHRRASQNAGTQFSHHRKNKEGERERLLGSDGVGQKARRKTLVRLHHRQPTLKKNLEDNRQEGMKLQETLKNQVLASFIVYLNAARSA
jgi:hypothetical protein